MSLLSLCSQHRYSPMETNRIRKQKLATLQKQKRNLQKYFRSKINDDAFIKIARFSKTHKRMNCSVIVSGVS